MHEWTKTIELSTSHICGHPVPQYAACSCVTQGWSYLWRSSRICRTGTFLQKAWEEEDWKVQAGEVAEESWSHTGLLAPVGGEQGLEPGLTRKGGEPGGEAREVVRREEGEGLSSSPWCDSASFQSVPRIHRGAYQRLSASPPTPRASGCESALPLRGNSRHRRLLHHRLLLHPRLLLHLHRHCFLIPGWQIYTCSTDSGQPCRYLQHGRRRVHQPGFAPPLPSLPGDELQGAARDCIW